VKVVPTNHALAATHSLLFFSVGAAKCREKQTINSNAGTSTMPQIHVFDAYAKSETGRIMHFDVVTLEKDSDKARAHARDWLQSIGEENATLNQENCCYCHSEQSVPEEMLKAIEMRGYAIYKLEGCPK
jgi:hypothetical protein